MESELALWQVSDVRLQAEFQLYGHLRSGEQLGIRCEGCVVICTCYCAEKEKTLVWGVGAVAN